MGQAPKWAGPIGAVWGVIGLVLILGVPVFRLFQKFLEAWETKATWGIWQWSLLIGFVAFMAYTEGYKGFQKAFSPRCAVRAKHLKDHPTWLRVVLAPLFLMAFFAATKKRLIVSYAITAMVIGFVLIFHLVPQPWKGILDVGVVVGLTWGLISFLLFLAPAFSGRLQMDPEVR